jgi:histidinol-phosphatase
MKRESPRSLLEFAVEVAWRAGRVTLAHYQTGISAELKPDDSPVTEADRAAERLARELIERRFPHDAILGEEFGETRPGAERRWILDPIDGTRSFARGVPLYGVLLAVEEAGEAIVGVLHFPALSESVYAARGEGCWWDGRRALVSEHDRMEQALLLTTSVADAEERGEMGWKRLASRAGLVRTWGDCYGYALVATGRADIMVDPVLAPWDAAALLPVIEEAGGVFTDWQGRTTHLGGDGIATNAALAREARALLTGTAP